MKLLKTSLGVLLCILLCLGLINSSVRAEDAVSDYDYAEIEAEDVNEDTTESDKPESKANDVEESLDGYPEADNISDGEVISEELSEEEDPEDDISQEEIETLQNDEDESTEESPEEADSGEETEPLTEELTEDEAELDDDAEEEAIETEDVEPEEESEEKQLEANWEDILSAGVFESDTPFFLTKDVVIPEDAILIIHEGEFRVTPQATLTVKGLLIIDGGKLTVSEGAVLNNEMFIQVENDGSVIVEGQYSQEETAAIVWDATAGASYVEGIRKSLIDKTVYASDITILNAVVSQAGFRTLTVLVPSPDMVKALDQIPNGVVLSVR